MVYRWFMCTLQRWSQLLLFLLTSSTSNNKKKTIGPAPHDIPYLPSDVIVDIVSRLPAECVMKCRQVCKRWLVITSSLHFAEMHRKRAVPVLVMQMPTRFEPSTYFPKSNLLNIFDDHAATDSEPKVPRPGSLKMIFGDEKVVLRGSGNGFLLFQRSSCSSYYVVCNLVTRESVTVTLPPMIRKVQSPAIRCRWTWCGILFNFGIGENILIFWGEIDYGKFCYSIYMLSSKKWREASTFSYRPRDQVDPIIVNGRLHWMSSSSSYSFRYVVSCPCISSIISCDMNVEGFRSMSHPGKECNYPRHQQMHLLEHEGKLAFGAFRRPSIAIWVLEDYDTWSWSLKYNVNLLSDVKCVRDEYDGRVDAWRIFNCELIFNWLEVGMIGYHLERKTTRRFDAPSFKNITPGLGGNNNVVSYVKCFVSLNSSKTVSW